MAKRSLLALLLIGAGVAAGFALASLFAVPEEPAGKKEDEREILYWTDPMIPGFKSDKPGKSPMGMEMVPVYADEAGEGRAALRIESAVVNNIGVRTASVKRGPLARRIETVGFVTPDDDRLSHIHVRSEGWIERLVADTEGEPVQKGEVLFEIYSRPLVSAQAEYLQARRSGQRSVIEAARARLAALGMEEGQIEAVGETGQVRQRADVRAPQDGIVMDLGVRRGMFIEPGTRVLSLADLSSVWVDVDVYEDQIDWLEVGQPARMSLPFLPGKDWRGRVDYVYPTIRETSRTGRIRLEFDNPRLQLKPGMYASVTIEADPRDDVLHVPQEALIRTARMERVILALEGGRFRPAEVRAGLESGGRVEILAGLSEGERIVTSSQFLIDSEASLEASFLRMLGTEDAAPAEGASP